MVLRHLAGAPPSRAPGLGGRKSCPRPRSKKAAEGARTRHGPPGLLHSRRQGHRAWRCGQRCPLPSTAAPRPGLHGRGRSSRSLAFRLEGKERCEHPPRSCPAPAPSSSAPGPWTCSLQSRWRRLAALAGCVTAQKLRWRCSHWKGLWCLCSLLRFLTFFTCAEAGRLLGSAHGGPRFFPPAQPGMGPAPTFPLSNSSSHSSMTVFLRAEAAD